jgi:hypothetical protein
MISVLLNTSSIACPPWIRRPRAFRVSALTLLPAAAAGHRSIVTAAPCDVVPASAAIPAPAGPNHRLQVAGGTEMLTDLATARAHIGALEAGRSDSCRLVARASC